MMIPFMDLTNMASLVFRFVSVSRKVGSCLINAVFIPQAAVCDFKMDTDRATKV